MFSNSSIIRQNLFYVKKERKYRIESPPLGGSAQTPLGSIIVRLTTTRLVVTASAMVVRLTTTRLVVTASAMVVRLTTTRLVVTASAMVGRLTTSMFLMSRFSFTERIDN
ncbi:hypothetical protein RRG08_057654 [Elysia crispata]|uniref:Uncharacterized protein n=1 Tax=Elysia crispata TaxID=231223 RepID=A0AAE1A103_9GAST|nr:hypothetical protein RRG08_057654 [Elysia crispata]